MWRGAAIRTIRQYRSYLQNLSEPVAVILGIYPTSNLGAVRNLGRCGIPTLVLDAKKHQAAFYSKYAKGITCPHPKYEQDAYIDFLLRLGEQLPQKGVLLPTGDTEVLLILNHRKQLETYYHFTSAPYDTVHSLINKEKFYRLLEKYTILHPKTFFPKTESDVTDASTELTYPCIVKPVYTTYFRLDFHTKLFKASTPQELLSYFNACSEKNHPVMFQEIIPGGPGMMMGLNAYYDKHSTPHGVFMYKRVREWPLTFGNGCCIQQTQEPLLEQITTTLMKKINYYGIVDAEFKRDPRDGTLNFIELNPRIWMQNSFPARYGSNHPLLAYHDALGVPLDDRTCKTGGDTTKWIYFLEDLQAARRQIHAGQLTFSQWITSYSLANEHAIFSWDDPLPFFLLGAYSISTFFSSILKPAPENKKKI